jgi:C1A family cysteine protease
MQRLTLSDVDRAIKGKGAQWSAERGLDPDLFEQMLGLSIGDETAALLVPASRSALGFNSTDLPNKVDWRSHDGGDWTGPVKAQGACRSCVSFAVVAAMECAIRIKSGNSAMAIDLSEADLFFCGGGTCDRGWELPSALNRARDHGIGLAEEFPYEPRQSACKTIASRHKIAHWRTLASRAQRQAAIAEEGPVIACMQVFEDLPYYRSGIYEHLTGNEIGLHAVCLVGYDNDDQCWIAKNSWSERWGEKGLFRIKYGQCCIDDALPSYALSIAEESS